jgi:lysyl-tRNA synthetase class I
MEKPEPVKNPVSPLCLKCGKQPKYVTSMLDPPIARRFHMFECECGDRSWISERASEM